jgi:hypothetical protein
VRAALTEMRVKRLTSLDLWQLQNCTSTFRGIEGVYSAVSTPSTSDLNMEGLGQQR